ncbi:hypothetical protein PG985_005289 [Apiospora marii]|uniref:uncharacterized protein n=1 Tax=Apiospora marii TaxID=335849 RepID=UPI00312D67EE
MDEAVTMDQVRAHEGRFNTQRAEYDEGRRQYEVEIPHGIALFGRSARAVPDWVRDHTARLEETMRRSLGEIRVLEGELEDVHIS